MPRSAPGRRRAAASSPGCAASRALPGWKRALVLFLLALLVPLFGALVFMVGLLLVGASFFSVMGGAGLASLILRL